MNHNARFWIVMGAGLIIAAGLFLAGCEVDSASSSIEITPDSVALGSKGQSVTLTAVGGYECTWSLATDTWGILNTRKGNQVVYTSLYQPSGELAVIQIVTLASKFTTMSGLDNTSVLVAATNIPSTNVHYATAYITHLPVVTSTTVAVTSLAGVTTTTSLGH
ncbi:MAG: hypothetical protein KKE37_03010 [Verrucomicrobia bacterium]|nr:hypothetical protein [Verrucomicrobiota bacterium]MBU4290343.1 hypothetical protein [Verrucomicrobiota bacterium]MBU4428307.1 hypothetical protein [Verrucomicrobiota bacterium]MCG2681473.1 hypothetical protein [Kiritimatiellia bacterium]